MNLADLKKSLSECHLTKEDKKTKFLLEVEDPSYYLHRVMECIASCQSGEEIPENTKLAIQLLNLYREKTRETLSGKRESTKRTRGEDTGGDHISVESGGLGSDSNSRE